LFKSYGESVAFQSGIYISSGKLLHSNVQGHVFTFADTIVISYRQATLEETKWVALQITIGYIRDKAPKSLLQSSDIKESKKPEEKVEPKQETPANLLSIFIDDEAQLNSASDFVPLVLNNLNKFKI